MQPFSSRIASSRTPLILWKRQFKAFAETGRFNLPTFMRSLIVLICGLLTKNQASCQETKTLKRLHMHKASAIYMVIITSYLV